MQVQTYERYPVWIVVLSVAVAAAIYAAGAAVLAGWGAWAVAIYLLIAVWVEVSVLRKSCVNCTYYGQRCALGKGKLCALLFRRGDPARFAQRQASWVDLLPDLLVSLVPLIGGIVLLFVRFSWWVVGLLVVLLALTFAGNAVVRGSFACKYCKQRLLGCPAQKLFEGRRG